jgi:hypothetical protein
VWPLSGFNSDGKAPMSNPAPQPDMVSHLRGLLEAVKAAACAIEGRWWWLAAPMLLVTWIRTRRERREAAEAMRAFQGLLEGFLGFVEEFRAGRLAVENAPEVVEEEEGTNGTVDAVACASSSRSPGPSPGSSPGAGPSSVRFAAQPLEGRGVSYANGTVGAVAHPSPSRSPGSILGSSPRTGAGHFLSLKGRGVSYATCTIGAVAYPSPSRSPGSILGSSPRTGAGPFLSLKGRGVSWRVCARPVGAWARPPPGAFFKTEGIACGLA